MKNNHRDIKIVEPERWGLNYTEKRKFYFQFKSSYWADSGFLALSNDAKTMFLWILSQSLTVNKGLLNVCLESACMILRCSLNQSKDMLNELEHNNIISLSTATRKTTKTQYIVKNSKEKNSIVANRNSDKPNPSKLVDEIFNLWNENCGKFDMPKIKVLNPKRKKNLEKAIKLFPGIEDWKKIFNSASQKGFTKDDRTWTPNWDWIFRNENYIKLNEEYETLFEEKPREISVEEFEKIYFKEAGLI